MVTLDNVLGYYHVAKEVEEFIKEGFIFSLLLNHIVTLNFAVTVNKIISDSIPLFFQEIFILSFLDPTIVV